MPGDSELKDVVERCRRHETAKKIKKNRHPMEKEPPSSRSHERWAHFRFSVIGSLLAAPPSRGQLQGQLQELAAKNWRHPISGQWMQLGVSTIERWYYKGSAQE